MRKLRIYSVSHPDSQEGALDCLTEAMSKNGIEENDVLSVNTHWVLTNERWYAEALYWTDKE